MDRGKPVAQPFSDTLKSLADIDANSGGTGAVGAIPVFDGTKFVWSAVVRTGFVSGRMTFTGPQYSQYVALIAEDF